MLSVTNNPCVKCVNIKQSLLLHRHIKITPQMGKEKKLSLKKCALFPFSRYFAVGKE